MASYSLTAKADVDLQKIWHHIAIDNLRAADLFIDHLYDKFQLLVSAPRIGVSANDISIGIRKLPINGYLIYYRPRRNGVTIQRILHGKRRQKQAHQQRP